MNVLKIEKTVLIDLVVLIYFENFVWSIPPSTSMYNYKIIYIKAQLQPIEQSVWNPVFALINLICGIRNNFVVLRQFGKFNFLFFI